MTGIMRRKRYDRDRKKREDINMRTGEKMVLKSCWYISQCTITMMKYLRQLTYKMEKFILPPCSGVSSSRSGRLMTFNTLWQELCGRVNHVQYELGNRERLEAKIPMSSLRSSS